MRTTVRNLACAAALVGATTLITARVVSQDHQQQLGDMEEMMQKWMEAAQPGREHAKMMRATGAWKQESKHWMHPGAEPEISEADVHMEPILGGRFMFEKVRGPMKLGEEVYDFEGWGIFGYDNIKQKHVFAWVDNLGTMIMTGEGTATQDAQGELVVYYSDIPNPMTGSPTKIKMTSRMVDDDHTVVEMFEQMPDGTWFRNMELNSNRTR